MSNKERIFIDQTEIVAGVTFGNQATRMSWKAEDLQEITIMQMEVKKLFKKEMQEMITIRKKSQPMGTPIIKTKADEKYWEGYKDQLEKFCKKNRVNFHDFIKNPMPMPGGPGAPGMPGAPEAPKE
ncbi:MAG: hypothetical protein J5633_04000 [Oscillospiraceae bacterium]|nr:hypothetical protein [Oscillospiraceae bacterium]